MSVLVASSGATLGTFVTCETFGLVTTSPGGGMSAAWVDIVDISVVTAAAATTNCPADPSGSEHPEHLLGDSLHIQICRLSALTAECTRPAMP